MSYDGTTTTIKSDVGELKAKENVTSEFEAIFLAVDMRTDENGQLHVADIHLGNLNQGLVLSVFHGSTAPTIASLLYESASLNYDVANFGEVGVIEGNIKGSVMSDDKFTAGGDPLYLSIGVNLEWQAPFFPDTDLGGRAQIN